MINLIIWSFNRAPQLYLLLESIQKFAPNIFHTSIIWKSSGPEFTKGYSKLFLNKNLGPIYKISETNFYQDTIYCIDNSNNSLICTSTDDCVLYRECPQINFTDIISDDTATFSLRYGLNTILQDYTQNIYQPPLTTYVDRKTHIEWNSADYHPNMNYGYPMGMDMHIYRRSLIQKLLKYEHFNSSNELETLLFNKKHLAPQLIKSFHNSVVVNVPNNNISGITAAMGGNLAENNRRYLDGEIIDLDYICQQKIIGSHQPINFNWKRN